MGKVRIEYARPKHVSLMLRDLREMAVPETVEWVNVGRTLQDDIQSSAWAYAGWYEDKLAVVWGVKASSMVSGYGYLWLISTSLCDQHPFLFARHSRIFVDQISAYFPVLHGLVERKYERSQKWLRWLGFTIVDTGNPVFYEFTNRSA